MSETKRRFRRKRLRLDERYYERGLLYYEKGKYDLAIADLDEAILLRPKKAEYYVARGMMLLENEQLDEASIDFSYALSVDAKQWLGYYGLALLALRRGDFEEARVQLMRASLLAPERPEIYYVRGIVLHLLGQSQEAVRDMEYAEQHFDASDKRARQAKKWVALFKK